MGRGPAILVVSTFFFVVFHYLMGGLTTHHLTFVGAVLGLYWIHEKSRLFLLAAIPVYLKDAIYDSLRYVPFDWLKPIHVSEPYQWDASLFGVVCGGQLRPVNECLLAYSDPLLDLICGVVYHAIGPYVYLLVFIFWQFKSWELAGRYSAAFLLMNLLAFATYLFYPAAAPWYVADHGFLQPPDPVIGSAAGLAGFDHLIGSDISARLYSANPVVFGAIPSMHVGSTLLGWLYSLRVNRPLSWVMGIFALLNAFSALYLQHHYLIDVVVGILFAGVAFFVIDICFPKKAEAVLGWLHRGLTTSRRRLVPQEVYVTESR